MKLENRIVLSLICPVDLNNVSKREMLSEQEKSVNEQFHPLKLSNRDIAIGISRSPRLLKKHVAKYTSEKCGPRVARELNLISLFGRWANRKQLKLYYSM